jgi:DNA (cytosine-5)-methyltransferase 1
VLTFGSVCSGIEAASVAWHPLGWRAAWFAEVDKAASQVLAHRFPDVPNHGDMTLLADKVRRREIPAPDILVGGTPCQAFSVAGLRGGLSDERGQLTLAFVLLADAIDEVRFADGLEPVIIVWENVPGVLNHKDNPFGCFLAGLAGESVPLIPAGRKWTNAGAVFGPERAIAWRTLDAQWFGLAQRRRRVFVVASARVGFDPGAILLEFDGVRRDSAPSREARQDVAGTLDARTDGGGFPGTDGACANHVVPADGRLRVSAGLTFGGGNQSGQIDVSTALTTKDRCDFDSQTFIVHGTQDPCVSTEIGFALGRNNGGENVICFSSKDYGADASADVSPTLRAGNHTDSHANAGCPPAIAVLPFDTTQVTSPGNYSAPAYGDPCHPLAAGAHAPAVCVTGDVTHTLKAEGFDASEDGTGRGQPIVAIDMRQASRGATMTNNRPEGSSGGAPGTGIGKPGDPCPTVSTSHVSAVFQDMAVRRLMPVECERLQGFPTVVNMDAVSMTRDEVIIAALVNGDIIVDAKRGKIYGTRGPGGHQLAEPRELGCQHPSGYIVINLTANGVKKQVRAHRVIWMSKYGMIPNGLVVDHQNNDKADNRIENLQLLTDSENSTKAAEDGLYAFDDSANTKLTVEVRTQLAHDYATSHASYRDLAVKYGISKSRVGQIIQEHGWTEVPTGKHGKPAADGPRYKQCGNSMATHCMNWIGGRIHRALLRSAEDYLASLDLL